MAKLTGKTSQKSRHSNGLQALSFAKLISESSDRVDENDVFGIEYENEMFNDKSLKTQ